MSPIITFTVNPTIDRKADVDRVVPESKLRCHDERIDPGGGGLNVASAINELGGEATAYFTRGGVVGGVLQRLLDDRGVL